MGIHQRTGRDFLPEEIELLTNIGNQVGIAVENARLYTQLQQISDEMSAINVISETVNQSLDLDQILNDALDKVLEVLNAGGGFIRLLDPEKQELVVIAHKGFSPDQVAKLEKRRKFGEGINWKVFQGGQVEFVEHRPDDPYLKKIRSFGLKIGAHYSILFPLKSKDKPYGTMAIYSLIPHRFSPAEINLCATIGNQIGVAIENAMLIKDLADSEQKYKNLFENSGEPLFVIDPEGKFHLVNRAVEKITGYSRDELIGQHFKKVVSPDHLDFIQNIFDSGYDHFSTLSTEISITDKNGQEHTIELLKGATRVEESGKLTGYLITARDLTERKKIEKKLLQSAKLQALGELAAGIAHDFNNSLTVIMGHAEMLQNEVEDQKTLAKLKIIEQAALNGTNTVKKIIDFTRSQPEKEEFKSINLNTTISNALELTSSRWRDVFQKKGLPFELDIELGEIPPLSGNDLDLQQAFINIFLNGMDAMPHGGSLSVKTRCLQEFPVDSTDFIDNTDGYVQIAIADTGFGMDEETRKNIFDPFFTTKGVKRLGLGLSNTYGIIKRHRGTIKVESIKGKQTTFFIYLPVLAAEPDSAQPVVPTSKGKQSARILVVDDEQDNVELLCELLTKLGHQAIAALSGQEALNKFQSDGPFDIVFTDLGMPKMSGWELTEQLKIINSQLPVVLITGWGTQLEEEEVKAKNVNFVLPKPFQINQLTELINHIL
jgi:PAS domain S-box-containing protein